jgi:hypothetical protein
MAQMDWFGAKGREASRLRRRKYEIVRQYEFPETLLPGSLTLTYRRCGKPSCHCVSDDGHPMWVLTFSLDGTKHVEVIPEAWVPELEPLVALGREHREALAELMKLNAQLLRLWRQEQRTRVAAKGKRPTKSKRTPRRRQRARRSPS